MDEGVTKKKLTIIDGSSLIYSASYNVSSKPDKTDDFFQYKQTLDYYLDKILDVTEADEYIIFGDGSSSYRKRLFDSFKADREVKKQYVKFKYDLLQYAIEHWGIYSHNDLESDDMCLITHNQFKNEYDITISAIDGDLRQYPAKFFNYGIFRKPDYNVKDGFETIDSDQANFNLWTQILQKGHNNKLDYLEGCGETCAKNYLLKFKSNQYPYAVLKAYIDGIPKQDGIRKEIPGYGTNVGIDKLSKSFKQTYLFRTQQELNELGIVFTVPEFKIRKDTYDGGETINF